MAYGQNAPSCDPLTSDIRNDNYSYQTREINGKSAIPSFIIS